MNIPKKIAEKVNEDDFVTFIDLSGQKAEIQTNFTKHVYGDPCYVGNKNSVYYFKFKNEASRDLFLKIINTYLNNNNINAWVTS